MKSINIFPWFLIVVLGFFVVGCGETTEDGTTTAFFKVTSSAFKSGSAIPVKYANTGVTGGQNISLPLSWTNAPAGTQSFALSMVDIHAKNFVHWLALNISASATSIPEDASTASMPGDEYTNDFATYGYGGPQPPTAEAAHSYVVTIYALNVTSESFTNSLSGNNLAAFNNAISGEVIGQAFLTGTFDR